MEKTNDHLCMGILNSCPVSKLAEKSITKKQTPLIEHTLPHNTKNSEKPWSVFEDLYWI